MPLFKERLTMNTTAQLAALSLLMGTMACGDDSPANGSGSGSGSAQTSNSSDTESGDPTMSGSGSSGGWAVQGQGEIAGGVVLSGFSNGDTMVMVGGRLSAAPGNEVGAPGVAYELQGDTLCRRSAITPNTLWWVDGPGDGTFIAVGERGQVLRYDGASFDVSRIETEATLYGVRPGSPAIAVGGDAFDTKLGEIWRDNEDGTWTPIATDLPGVAFKIWNDWIVGNGIAYQLDGDTLIDRTPPGEPLRLLTVRGRADDDVWAVGGTATGIVMHWDGAQWETLPVNPECSMRGLNGVWTAPGEDVYIAGFSSTMSRFDGLEWDCTFPPETEYHLHATWQHQGEVWFGGGSLFDLGSDTGFIARMGGAPLAYEISECAAL